MSFMCLRDFLSALSLCTCTPPPSPLVIGRIVVSMVGVHVESQHSTIKDR